MHASRTSVLSRPSSAISLSCSSARRLRPCSIQSSRTSKRRLLRTFLDPGGVSAALTSSGSVKRLRLLGTDLGGSRLLVFFFLRSSHTGSRDRRECLWCTVGTSAALADLVLMFCSRELAPSHGRGSWSCLYCSLLSSSIVAASRQVAGRKSVHNEAIVVGNQDWKAWGPESSPRDRCKRAISRLTSLILCQACAALEITVS